jgi:hypothetical protein
MELFKGTNGAGLFIIVIGIWIAGAYIFKTINVHLHNTLIKKKIGEGAYRELVGE